MKESEIKFSVTLDDNKVPEKIQWEAGDSGMPGKKDCSATLLAIWDSKEHTTLRIDLWTKEMPVEDMKRFFYESFISMADSYQRSTEDAVNAEEIRKFGDWFGKKALGT